MFTTGLTKTGLRTKIRSFGTTRTFMTPNPQKHGFAAISKNMIRIIYMKVSLFKSRRFMSRRILREVIYHWWTRGERSEEKKEETVWEQVFVTTKTKKTEPAIMDFKYSVLRIGSSWSLLMIASTQRTLSLEHESRKSGIIWWFSDAKHYTAQTQKKCLKQGGHSYTSPLVWPSP